MLVDPTTHAESSLGPAMQFVLNLGRARTVCAALSPEWKRLTELWDIAERYHPEETWWASTYLGGARTFEELAARAPRNVLAPSLRHLPEGRLRDLFVDGRARNNEMPSAWEHEPRARQASLR